MAAFNPTQLVVLQEMKELLNSATKRLDRMMLSLSQQQEEATMKKTLRESFSVMDVDSICDGNDSGLSVIAADEPDLIEDQEIEASLSDGGEDGPELLGDEGRKADLISTDGFKVELKSSDFIEEVVFGAAENNQLGAFMKHGQIVDLEIDDQIGQILTERRAATSTPSDSMEEKKKKEEKEDTSFVKDRGKMSPLQGRWLRLRQSDGKAQRQKADQSPSHVRSSVSASASASAKKTKAATFVKDRGKPCVAVRARGRRGSVTATRSHGSSKEQGGGCEEAWSRRVAIRR